MKTNLLIVLIILTVSVLRSPAQDENRFGFEFSTGASFPISEINETELNTGFGFEGIFHYRFLPHLGAYGGWGWNSFGADESFAGNDVNFEETGYVLGLQYKHPFGTSPVSYYLRAGGLYNHIETENEDGDVINDSGHGFGYQLAAGIDIPVGRNWSLTPGLKFQSLERDSEFNNVSTEMNYSYLQLRFGILKTF